MGRKQTWKRKHLFFYITCVIIVLYISAITGCALKAKHTLENTQDFMVTGDFKQALGKYQQQLKEDPQNTDVALFHIGLIYAHPKNPDKNHKKSLQYFKRVIKEFPESNLKNQAQTYASLLNKITKLSIKNGKQHKEIIGLKEKCTILKKDNQEKDKKSDELQQQIEKLKEIDLNIQKKKRPINHK